MRRRRAGYGDEKKERRVEGWEEGGNCRGMGGRRHSRGLEEWNEIPAGVKRAKKVNEFKNGLKIHLRKPVVSA